MQVQDTKRGQGESLMKDICGYMGDAIREKREEIGLSRTKLAEMIGCTERSVFIWENGVHPPSSCYLPGLADAFGCSIDELFGR